MKKVRNILERHNQKMKQMITDFLNEGGATECSRSDTKTNMKGQVEYVFLLNREKRE